MTALRPSRRAVLLLIVLLATSVLARGPAQAAGATTARPRQVRALDFAPLDHVGGAFTGVAVDGSWAYVTRGLRLEVYDVTFPLDPRLVGAVEPLPDDARVVAAGGGMAYLVSHVRERQPSGPFVARLYVVDASQPQAPIVKGNVAIGDDLALVESIVVRGRWLYLSAQNAGLVVIDAADPAQPRKVAAVQLAGWPYGVADVGGILVAAIGQTADGGLIVLDTSDPSLPVPVGRLRVGQYGTGVCAAHGFALLIVADSLHVVDLSDRQNPRIVATAPATYGVSCAYAGEQTYLLTRAAGQDDSNHLQMFGTPALPAIAAGASLDLPARQGSWLGTTLAVAGGYALVADVEMGLRVIGPGASADAAPAEQLRLPTLGEPTGIALDGGYAYVVDYDDELWVLDIGIPTEPVVVGRTDIVLPGAPGYSGGGALVVRDGYAYVTRRPFDRLPFDERGFDAPGSLHVVDVRNPNQPHQIGVWQPATGGARPELADLPITGAYPPLLRGDHVLIPGQPALTEIDVSHPDAPVLVRTYGDDYAGDQDPLVGGAALDGDTAWLATGERGVEQVDLANPAGIVSLLQLGTPGSAADVAVVGERLAVADGLAGLRLLDRATGALAGTTDAITADRVIWDGATLFVFRHMSTSWGASDPSVWALDLTSPAAPVIRGHYSLRHPYFPWDMLAALAVTPDVLYVAEGRAGLGVIRITAGDTLPTPRPTATATGTRQSGGTRTATPSWTHTPTAGPSPQPSATDPVTAPPPSPTGSLPATVPPTPSVPSTTPGTAQPLATPAGTKPPVGESRVFLPITYG